jgi:hypothetical protein
MAEKPKAGGGSSRDDELFAMIVRMSENFSSMSESFKVLVNRVDKLEEDQEVIQLKNSEMEIKVEKAERQSLEANENVQSALLEQYIPDSSSEEEKVAKEKVDAKAYKRVAVATKRVVKTSKKKVSRRSSIESSLFGSRGVFTTNRSLFDSPAPDKLSMEQFTMLSNEVEFSNGSNKGVVLRSVEAFPEGQYLTEVSIFAFIKFIRDVKQYRFRSKEDIELCYIISPFVCHEIAHYLTSHKGEIFEGKKVGQITSYDVESMSNDWILWALSRILRPRDSKHFYDTLRVAMEKFDKDHHDAQLIRSHLRVNAAAVSKLQRLFFRYNTHFMDYYRVMHSMCISDEEADLEDLIPRLYSSATKETLYNLYVNFCPSQAFMKMLVEKNSKLTSFVSSVIKKDTTDVTMFVDEVVNTINSVVEDINKASKSITVLTSAQKEVVEEDSRKSKPTDVKLKNEVYKLSKQRMFGGQFSKQNLQSLHQLVVEALMEEGETVESYDETYTTLAAMSGSSPGKAAELPCLDAMKYGFCARGPTCAFNHSPEALQRHGKQWLLSLAKHVGPPMLYHELVKRADFLETKLLQAPDRSGAVERKAKSVVFDTSTKRVESTKPRPLYMIKPAQVSEARLELEDQARDAMGGNDALDDSMELFDDDAA